MVRIIVPKTIVKESIVEIVKGYLPGKQLAVKIGAGRQGRLGSP